MTKRKSEFGGDEIEFAYFFDENQIESLVHIDVSFVTRICFFPLSILKYFHILIDSKLMQVIVRGRIERPIR